MTARERIDALLDPKSPRIEIGAFAADGMYKPSMAAHLRQAWWW
jgi:acetyl-CoA carboxylase carboxyltransferase component